MTGHAESDGHETAVDHTNSSDAKAGGSNTTTSQLGKLSAFRFDAELTPSLRRSPRGHAPNQFAKFKEDSEDDELPVLASPPTKSSKANTGYASRKRSSTLQDVEPENSEEVVDARSKKRARKVKEKAGFAPPEKYAHLENLTDCLGDAPDMLDVLFCGINPGRMSAMVGHHFAHPTNHFWRCLHGSGLTDRLLLPAEDGTLPTDYKLGLTDLVERPSVQAAELADSEFTDGAPALLRKIVEKRPRVLCFVGKGIWESFIRAVAPNGTVRTPTLKLEDSVETKMGVVSSTSRAATKVSTTTRVKKAKVKAEPFAFGLQPYKVVHESPDALVRETLFFVIVSTSARVAHFQLPQKTDQFILLKERVAELKKGTYDTSVMTVIPAPL